MMKSEAVKPVADVMLILEGTYPYVRGGVSSWVHQLIQGLPERTFELVFIGGAPNQYGPIQYALPDNVTRLHVHYLMDNTVTCQRERTLLHQNKIALFEQWQTLLTYFRDSTNPIPDDLVRFMFASFATESGLTFADFLYHHQAWNVLTQHYFDYFQRSSFIDFFWTFRNIYKPLFVMANLARKLPKTRLIHSVSTGYAGLLGAGLSEMQDTPFIITEHGIYTKERKIDLLQADWINDAPVELGNHLYTDMGYIRKMWIHFFEQLGRTSYRYARQITALYEGNRQRQIRDGAPTDKTRVIPNGINLDRFTDLANHRSDVIPHVVGLIGRVVPIKDIKTFIRAIKEAQHHLPDLQGWIVGPTEEDPDYVQECKLLTASLDLNDNIRFLGMQDVTRIFPQLGAVALTSISEAQPLVLLEAMASGVPVLATDVGACRAIIEGDTPEDKALGAAGRVVSIASPGETASAICQLLSNRTQWRAYHTTGLARTTRFYNQSLMFERYRTLYRETLSWPE